MLSMREWENKGNPLDFSQVAQTLLAQAGIVVCDCDCPCNCLKVYDLLLSVEGTHVVVERPGHGTRTIKLKVSRA